MNWRLWSLEKKTGGMWMIYDTYAKKTKETKEDNYGQ